MKSIKEEIQNSIAKSVKSLFAGQVDFSVDVPAQVSYGDYFTNIAFVLAKTLKKNPNQVAEELKSSLEKNKIFKKVEVMGGFINFFLDDKIFIKNLILVLKNKKTFGQNDSLKNKKIIIEYTDPNPFKEFHIGHLMSNTIGESISRVLEFQGANIKRANYQGDVGLHVAKGIWAKQKNPNQGWQEAYVMGNAAYEKDEIVRTEIIELNKKIFERSDNVVNALYDQGKKESLEYFEGVYKKLGTYFDYYFFESQMAPLGKKLVEDGLKKGIFEVGAKGAIVFKGESQGLHTRVFINSEGLPTYEAKELALAQEKYKKYKYDQSVVVTGNEINEYFRVLKAAMSDIFPLLEKKTKHLGHGMLRLPEGKMSSRTGNVVAFQSLLKSVEAFVKQKLEGRNLSEEEQKHILEKVAISALKYSILRQAIGGDIIYDVQKSLSFEGDSGPYLQYSYARAISVLQKAKSEKIKPQTKVIPEMLDGLSKKIFYFPEIVQKAGDETNPHIITTYLTELASLFNAYYAQSKIVDVQDQFSPYRVALTEAFSIVMKNGLWLLGIEALEKM